MCRHLLSICDLGVSRIIYEGKERSLCFPELFCLHFLKIRARYLCVLAWIQANLVSEFESFDTVNMYVCS